jgi:AcrR family transcriptional regulator
LAYHHGNLRYALLEEAAEVIRERGVGALSLRDLARRVGVSHGAPSRHFPDKGALLTSLATDALQRFQAALLGGIAEAGDSALDRHRAIGMGYVRFAIEHPAYFRLMTSRPFLFEPDAEFDAAYQQIFETIREATIAAQQEGWATTRDPDDLLMTAWSVVHGFAMLWVEGAIQDQFGSIDPEIAASAVIEIVYASEEKEEAPGGTSRAGGRSSRSRSAGSRRLQKKAGRK